MLTTKNATAHEEAFMCTGALADRLEKDFEVRNFFSNLNKFLEFEMKVQRVVYTKWFFIH